jgi:hypothetical protein
MVGGVTPAKIKGVYPDMGDDIMSILMRLEAGQTRLDTGLSSLEAGQAKLRIDVMERIDRLQDTVTAIRDDIVVNFGATDAVKRAHDSTREEMRAYSEILTQIVRKVRTLESQVRELRGES